MGFFSDSMFVGIGGVFFTHGFEKGFGSGTATHSSYSSLN